MEPNVEQQMLAELGRVRRLVKRSLITFLVIFSFFVAASIWQGVREEGAYTEANRAVRALDYARATRIAESLAARQPQDYSAHEYLGKLYLMQGDLAKAEEAYSRAYSLYASEETSGILEDIRRTRGEVSPAPGIATSASPAAQPTPEEH